MLNGMITSFLSKSFLLFGCASYAPVETVSCIVQCMLMCTVVGPFDFAFLLCPSSADFEHLTSLGRLRLQQALKCPSRTAGWSFSDTAQAATIVLLLCGAAAHCLVLARLGAWSRSAVIAVFPFWHCCLSAP